MQSYKKIFIGIDFSKEKFDACMLREDCGVMCDAVSFENSKRGYGKLMTWAKRTSELGSDYRLSDILFCGENTGVYGLGLSEYVFAKGGDIWIENPYTIKMGSGLVRGKDDKADAEMIAYYASRFYEPGRSRLYKPLSDEMKQLRSLYELRDRTMRYRVAAGNRLGSKAFEFSPLARKCMKRQHEELKKDEKALEKEIKSLMEQSEEFCENYRILTSFKGVGTLTAALLIIHTENFTKFTSARKFSCYGGMAPFGKQSGTSINTRPHVSHLAHKDVKAALVQTAKSAIKDNPVIRRYAARLKATGKKHGVVMNNVKNKMLHILFKMIETHRMWDATYCEIHDKASSTKTGSNATCHTSESKNHEKHRRGCASAWGPASGPQERPRVAENANKLKKTQIFSQNTCIFP